MIFQGITGLNENNECAGNHNLNYNETTIKLQQLYNINYTKLHQNYIEIHSKHTNRIRNSMLL